MTRRITLKDVAAHAGLSVSAVSQALRQSRRIPEPTRQRVLVAARALGYAPDPGLSALAAYRVQKRPSRRREVIAVLGWNRESGRDAKSRERMDALKARAAELGYAVEHLLLPEIGGPAAVRRVLLSRGIRGVCVESPPPEQTAVPLDLADFACVAIGEGLRSPPIDRVVDDRFTAIFDLLTTLHARGYRRIGLVSMAPLAQRTRFKSVGALEAFHHHASVPTRERIPPLSIRATDNRDAQIGPWLRTWKPDVIISRDHTVLDWLRAEGRQVPKDIGFASLSLPVAERDTRSVAGLWRSFARQGVVVAEHLHGLILANRFGVPEAPLQLLVRAEWQEGDTIRADALPAPEVRASR